MEPRNLLGFSSTKRQRCHRHCKTVRIGYEDVTTCRWPIRRYMRQLCV